MAFELQYRIKSWEEASTDAVDAMGKEQKACLLEEMAIAFDWTEDGPAASYLGATVTCSSLERLMVVAASSLVAVDLQSRQGILADSVDEEVEVDGEKD